MNPHIAYALTFRERILSRPQKSEADLQKNCAELWAQWYAALEPNAMFHHSPNGGARSGREGAKFKTHGVTAGFPDVLILLPGAKALFIELKHGKGRQSEGQKMAEAKIKACGFEHYVVYNVLDFAAIIDQYIPIPDGAQS